LKAQSARNGKTPKNDTNREKAARNQARRLAIG
jgi:hypothetical protein